MKLKLSTIILISRPRFWLYLAGPFIVGYAAGVQTLQDFFLSDFWLYLLYFLVPANVFLYGINDLADDDTDQFNQKKSSYEHSLSSEERRPLIYLLAGCVVVSILTIFMAADLSASLLLVSLLFLSYAYSYLPFRWKAKPFIDSLSNSLYVIPGLFAYYITAGALPSFNLMLAGCMWSAAMHLFSAIPDIAADKKADLNTTAVVLGERGSLWLCSMLWCMAALLVLLYEPTLPLFLLGVYALIPILIIVKNISVAKAYTFFPMLNAITGFLLFWYIIVNRFF